MTEEDTGVNLWPPQAYMETHPKRNKNEAKDYEIFPPSKFLFANPASSHFGIF